MMGAVGTGKTHMAIALDVEACRRGMDVQFFRAADLRCISMKRIFSIILGGTIGTLVIGLITSQWLIGAMFCLTIAIIAPMLKNL